MQITKVALLTAALVSAPGFAFGQDASLLLAGTRLRVRLETSAATKTARSGDGVEATLLEPIRRDRRILLPAGTRLLGRVDDVRPADRDQGLVAQIDLKFGELRIESNATIRTNASVLDVGSDQTVNTAGIVTMARRNDMGDALGAGSLVGSLVGLLVSRTERAVIIGGIIGAALFGIGELAGPGREWQDFELKAGRRIWLRLDDNLSLAAASIAAGP